MTTTTETKLHQADAFQSDDDHPTVTFVAADRTLALPYHLMRSLDLGKGERSVTVLYDDYRIMINGANLTRLWHELRAFHVREVVINSGKIGKALADQHERCVVESIAIELVDGRTA